MQCLLSLHCTSARAPAIQSGVKLVYIPTGKLFLVESILKWKKYLKSNVYMLYIRTYIDIHIIFLYTHIIHICTMYYYIYSLKPSHLLLIANRTLMLLGGWLCAVAGHSGTRPTSTLSKTIRFEKQMEPQLALSRLRGWISAAIAQMGLSHLDLLSPHCNV